MEDTRGETKLKPLHLARLDDLMAQQKVDALICRLPENVLYLTGTLPVHGVSVAFYPVGGVPVLLQPGCEDLWVKPEHGEVEFFRWGHLGDPVLLDVYFGWFDRLLKKYGEGLTRLGMEINVSVSAPAFSSAENLLPDGNWQMMLAECFPDIHLIDCRPLLTRAFSIKGDEEIASIRRANEIAQFGLQALSENLEPGMREVEAAALVESTIRIRGVGCQGAHLVRGFAHVMSGVDGTFRQSMLTPSRNRIIHSGDLVMIELAVQSDGFWSDLTRTYCVGIPTDAQRMAYSAVWKAQRAAVNMVKAGTTSGAVDKAARDVLTEEGYGEYFKHGTGHGVGYRYHEPIPALGPGSDEILQAGMVTSIEPGIYITGLGGFRIEDNVVVTAEGCEVLSSPMSELLPY